MPKSAKEEVQASTSLMEDGQPKQTDRRESVGLLNTIDKGLEDIRAVITCRVCVRPLYEPLTIECGHTFCYSCLVSWFEKNTANKSCPDCRATVSRKPAPAYLVRDITQLFSTRAELLPASETTQEHQDQQKGEARILEEDRNGPGLFRGCFRREERHVAGAGNRIIIDVEDGVSRCPRCTWEMDDGECAGCGWPGDADSWDPDSGDSLVDAENEIMVREMGLVTDYDSETGVDSERDPQEHEGEEDDDSAGSLDGFVVNDGQTEGTRPRPTPRRGPIQWRFPRLETRDFEEENSDSFSSSIGADSGGSDADTHPPDQTLHDETDADPMFQFGPSRSVSVDSVSNDGASDPVQDATHNTRSVRNRVVLVDSDDESIASIARVRNPARRRPNRAGSSGRAGSRPIRSDILQLSSDSDESIRRPHIHRRRVSPYSRIDFNGELRSFVGDEEEVARNAQQRTVQRTPSAIQAMRRGAARSRVILDDDEDEAGFDAENTRPRVFNGQDVQHQQTLHQRVDGAEVAAQQNPRDMAFGLGEQQRSAQQEAQTFNRRESDQHRDVLAYNSGFDPITSIPVRRENVNMPGAFPPSFVSEQGPSQPVPIMNAEDSTSPPLPHRSSTNRPSRPTEERDQAFLDRRRHEEHATHATHAEQTRLRERSAAKAARRQDRQRMKAERQSRRRTDDGLSVSPLTTL